MVAWGLFGDRSRSRRCLRCGYDMGAVPGLRCPECGREAKGEAGLVGTRRRWGRAAAGVVCLSVGGLAAVHAALSRTPGGWWRLAPTPMLLAAVEHPGADGARMALGQRIQSDDRFDLEGRGEALSERQWRQLAERCERIILSAQHSSELTSWAVVMLCARIPDPAHVDPSIERILRTSDCAARGWIAIGVTTMYHDRFGSMGDIWMDDLVAFAVDPSCGAQNSAAVTLAARQHPLPREFLRALAAELHQHGNAGEIWKGLTLGLARGSSYEADRIALLEEFAAEGSPMVQRFVEDALAEMATYRRNP